MNLQDKRILVTRADTFMGPALCDVLTQLGATVIGNKCSLLEADAPERTIREAGRIDVLVVNLASVPIPRTAAVETSDDEWRLMFECLVHPTQRLVRAVLPQMMERRSGKILVMGSASVLRGQKLRSTHAAARGAQIAYVQSVGVEVAPYNIQVNAIAQNFVESASYYRPEEQSDPNFKERLREVPLGRLVRADEDARFAAYLCSDAADCFVGQVFPVCGGWAR